MHLSIRVLLLVGLLPLDLLIDFDKHTAMATSALDVDQNNQDSDSYSYGSESDALSFRSGSGRGASQTDSAQGCSPAPSIYSYHPSVDGNAVSSSLQKLTARATGVLTIAQLREVYGRYFNSHNEVGHIRPG